MQLLDWPLGGGPKMQLNSILLLKVEQRQLPIQLVASCLASFQKISSQYLFLINNLVTTAENVTLLIEPSGISDSRNRSRKLK